LEETPQVEILYRGPGYLLTASPNYLLTAIQVHYDEVPVLTGFDYKSMYKKSRNFASKIRQINKVRLSDNKSENLVSFNNISYKNLLVRASYSIGQFNYQMGSPKIDRES
jgi:hypothetical protein